MGLEGCSTEQNPVKEVGMGRKRWESFVEREYLDADYDFVEDVLPCGSVDGSSFGLISDATEYTIVKAEGEVHIKPDIHGLDSLLNSLRRGGVTVGKKDALASVERFAELWEERIKGARKWEKVVRIAEEEGAIRLGTESKEGRLTRLARLFKRKGA